MHGDPEAFEPGSVEAEAHLEKLKRLGMTALAEVYAREKGLVHPKTESAEASRARAPSFLDAPSFRIAHLVGSLAILYMGVAVFCKNVTLVVFTPIDGLMLTGIFAGLLALGGAIVTVRGAEYAAIPGYRRAQKIGSIIAIVAGVITAALY